MEKIFYWQWEAAYMGAFQHLGDGSFLQTLLVLINNFFSMFGEELLCVLVMGFVYWGVNKDKGIRLGFSVVMANVANSLLKNIFCRIRPYKVLDDVELLRDVDGYSFPSGHSANSAAIYPGVAYEFKDQKWYSWFKYVAVILPVCVALSRNYLGAHWPTDVIVGLVQGAAVLLLVELLYAKVSDEKIIFLVLFLIGGIGLFYCKTDDYFSSYGMLIGAILGRLFEQKYVHFENSSRLGICIYRTILGGALFMGLNVAMKAVFGAFGAGGYAVLLLRTLRYAINVFILLGIYPMAFRLENKNRRTE